MALQIIQIPPQETVALTGTTTEDSLIPINWKPLAPIVVKQSSDVSSWFKFRFILRVYKNAVIDSNLLATLRQSPNNFSTTTNTNAIFDLRGIVNTQINATFEDYIQPTKEIHKIGENNPARLFSKNSNTVKTIIVKATYEYATTSTSAPIEQTGSPVQLTMYFAMSSFGTFEYLTLTNPLDSFYIPSSSLKFMLSDLNEQFDDVRHKNQLSSAILNGYINYVNSLTDYHTIGFVNKDSWGSDSYKLEIKYYNSSGSTLSTTLITNETTTGGEAPNTANQDNEYLIFAGVGTGNLESQTINTDAQPSDSANNGWSFYSVRLKNATTSYMSVPYYFVKDFNANENCKGVDIVRLGWVNSLGAWDYFNFNAGQTQRVENNTMRYGEILGTSSLDSDNSYNYYNWQGGTKTYMTNTKLKTSLSTQYITEQESQFLESLFRSNNVMIIQSGSVVPVSQSVVISNKSFIKKEQAKDKLQIQHTFEIEYSNNLNNNQ